jgi:hypothetical protein
MAIVADRELRPVFIEPTHTVRLRHDMPNRIARRDGAVDGRGGAAAGVARGILASALIRI